MSNYKDWIDAVDIKVDYFSAFMKAWIAFNSWYESGEIHVSKKTDKEYIEHLANNTNRFKSYINSLLNANNTEGKTYRDSVANLHESLLNAAITTQEYIGMQQSVSFSEVAIKNTNTIHKFDYYKNHYECKRVGGTIVTTVSIKTSGSVVFTFSQSEYNIEELKDQVAFQRLKDNQKEQCITCYKELRPYKIESVLSAIEDNSFQMGTYNFVNDINSISRAIVLVLYLLRCCLAHGDVSPDDSANRVYRYAYEVLVAPLKKLR